MIKTIDFKYNLLINFNDLHIIEYIKYRGEQKQ